MNLNKNYINYNPLTLVNKGLMAKCILIIQNAIPIFLSILFLFFTYQLDLNAQENFEILESEESAKKINKSNKNNRKIIKKTDAESEKSEENNAIQSTSTNPNIFDYSQDDIAGINALMMAVNNNDIAGVSFYSKAGSALINQKNIGGATPLLIASREGYYEIAKILIDNGADINVVDNEGWTPLMRANINARDEIVALLVSKGAQAGSLNYTGESVIMHATLANCEKCLNIMFAKINFLQGFSLKTLKEQITDSFIISRNRENPKIQGLLEAFLDRIIKVSPSISNEEFKKKMAQDTSDIAKAKIIEDLINKEQNKNVKTPANNTQAVLVADFIDKNNQAINLQKNNKQAEIDKKIQQTESKNNSKISSRPFVDSSSNNPVSLNNVDSEKNSALENKIKLNNDIKNSPKESIKKFIFKKLVEENELKPVNDSKIFVLKPPSNYQDNSALSNDSEELKTSSINNSPFKIISDITSNKKQHKSTKNNNYKEKLIVNNSDKQIKTNANQNNISKSDNLSKNNIEDSKTLNPADKIPANQPKNSLKNNLVDIPSVNNNANGVKVEVVNPSQISNSNPSPSVNPNPIPNPSPVKSAPMKSSIINAPELKERIINNKISSNNSNENIDKPSLENKIANNPQLVKSIENINGATNQKPSISENKNPPKKFIIGQMPNLD